MLRVISINIERSKHIPKVLDFLQQEIPDVLCLQEVMEHDLSEFETLLRAKATFVPMTTLSYGVQGVAIITALPAETYSVQYAGAKGEGLPNLNVETYAEIFATQKFQLLIAQVKTTEADYTICTTHAPVTEKATITDYQIRTIESLLSELEGLNEFVLFGDFNAPRGLQPFSMLAEKYQDNIPLHYTSSIDPNLHRSGPLEVMVDGCFSTPGYQVDNVRLVSGVSDHCAIYAEISRVAEKADQ